MHSCDCLTTSTYLPDYLSLFHQTLPMVPRLSLQPLTEGYLAIVNPPKMPPKPQIKLLTPEQYRAHLAARDYSKASEPQPQQQPQPAAETTTQGDEGMDDEGEVDGRDDRKNAENDEMDVRREDGAGTDADE